MQTRSTRLLAHTRLSGPNFSFAVFLGFLSLPSNPVLGGFLAYLAIFSPGLLLKAALIPVYRKIRDKPVVRSVLLGLNAGATGLIFSAVYRLWIVGALLPDSRVRCVGHVLGRRTLSDDA